MWLNISLVVILVGLLPAAESDTGRVPESNESLTAGLSHVNSSLTHMFNLLDYLVKVRSLRQEPQSKYRIRKVSRRDIGNYYQVTVDYFPSFARLNASVIVRDGRQSHHNRLPIRYPGQVTANVPKDSYSVEIHLHFPQNIAFALSLSTSSDSSFEMDIPRVLITASPENRDLVIEPGSPSQLELILWIEELDGVAIYEQFGYRFLVRSTTAENGMYEFRSGRRGNPIGLQVQRLSALSQWMVSINSTLPDPEGLLMVRPEIGFTCASSRCLVTSMEGPVQNIAFHGPSHPAPFPEGSLRFLFHWSDGGRNPSNDFATGKLYCLQTMPCWVTCEAGVVGTNDGLSVSTEIVQVTPGGNIVIIDEGSDSWRTRSTSEQRLENITANDAGRVFRCRARLGRREISRDAELVVVQRTTFIGNLSNLIRFINGSAAVTCVAEGVPAPTVNIEVQVPGMGYRVYPGATVTKLNETTTKATIFFPNNVTTTEFRCQSGGYYGVTYYDDFRPS